MIKTYILDTNVLLHNPEALFSFEDNHIVIPFTVIEEIDGHKRRQDDVGRNARVVIRKLDEMRGLGHLSEGIALPGGGNLRIELNHAEMANLPPVFDAHNKDNRILAVAACLMKKEGLSVTLVTKDLNLRIKADVLGIPAEDFYNDKVDFETLYGGIGQLAVTAEQMETFYATGQLKPDPQKFTGLPNQFFVLKNPASPSQSALGRFWRGVLVRLNHSEAVNFGIKARNKEQQFALELLLNDQIKVVTLAGPAGTGKTLLALAVGLEKVVEQGGYSRLLITRPVTPLGEDLGYLPGSKEEKLRPWMQPIYDNLEYVFNKAADPSRVQDHLFDRGIIELEALTYIRGRSIPNQFIICDEAQNLSPHMIKTLVTRVGEGTKIVFTGDPEQIDHPYLDSSSNGLTYLVEKLKAEDISGHVTLVKGERSSVAEMGAKLL